MMRLPGRDQLLDYAEHASGQEAEVQKRILQILASSQILREQLAEVKRDLYLVSSQIPDYTPDSAFGSELFKLSQSWLQLVYSRKFSLAHFYRSREFFGIMIALVGVILLALAMLGLRLGR
jgi:hypothetical protein